MGTILVLRSKEVATILENLGFQMIRQKGHIDNTDIQTAEAPKSLFIQEEISPLCC